MIIGKEAEVRCSEVEAREQLVIANKLHSVVNGLFLINVMALATELSNKCQ